MTSIASRFIAVAVAASVGLAARAGAQTPAPAPAPSVRPASPAPPAPRAARRPADRDGSGDALYTQARELIERSRYDAALERLNRLVGENDGKDAASAIAARADAAMYWTAYVQAKLQQRDAALATLASLQKRFADSRWIKDARALEVEVRQASGQPVSPDSQPDEDLKLLALRGLMQNDPDRALPTIEAILSGGSSVKVKENALFVLSQSRAPRAREVLANVAKGTSNPDLQLRAVRYLGIMNRAENRPLLDEIYRSSTDPAVKSAVVQALFIGNSAAQLVALARAEKDPAMKKDIVSKLSIMRSKEATDYLVELLK